MILTRKGSRKTIPGNQKNVVEVELQEKIPARKAPGNIVSGVQPDNLAYMIYTSGSTGKPKGVMIAHCGVVNYLNWCRKQYLVAPEKQVPLHSSISFDLTVTSIFAPLQSGQCVHLLSEEERADALSTAIREGASYDFVKLTPSHLDLLAQQLGEKRLELVAPTLIVGGEALTAASVQHWRKHAPHVHIVNEYGPTETVVGCCTYTISADEEGLTSDGLMPIGTPIENMRMYVLDQHLAPVPIGVQGELYIGGEAVGRGYWQQPEKTASVFVPDPFEQKPGQRLYRTGDFGYWQADGNLVYVGRRDQQVKVRGFRIELGEIEAVLRMLPLVQACVVDVRENALHGKRLVAYIVPTSTQAATVKDIREALKNLLPEYMVPVVIMLVDALPLTPNGKVDRRALPEPTVEQAIDEAAVVAPVTATKKILVEVWRQVLGLKHVGVHDNFFELGGDSIVSMLMVLKARDAGLEVTSKQLFQHQTIAELAPHAKVATPLDQTEEVVQGLAPLTPIQRWFFAQDLPSSHHWNQSVLLDIRGQIDPALLQESLKHVFAAHDALHLRFTFEHGDWQQRYASAERAVPLQVCDLRATPVVEQDTAIVQAVNEMQASFRLSSGPICGCILFDLGMERLAKLFLAIHHLAVDIVSWQILLTDLHTLCQQGQRGEPLQLPPKTTSYQSWAEQLASYAQSDSIKQEAAYWLARNWHALRPLPVDYAHGANVESSARTLSTQLDSQDTQLLLRDLPKSQHMQVYEILLTALALALVQWTGNAVQLIDMEGHGREDMFSGVDLSRTVGWFTTIIPVCLAINEKEKLDIALKAVKEQVRTLPNGGIGYGLLRYLCQDIVIKRQFSQLPTADIVFNYEGQSAQVLEDVLFAPSRGIEMCERALEGKRTHLLAFSASVRHGCLEVGLTYSENVHAHRTIEQVLACYIEKLRAIIHACPSSGKESFTPSDFPEAALSQQQLDSLMAKLSRQM